MRLFGKKANPESTKSDLPPELQPYYETQSIGVAQRLPRRFVLLLVVLALVVIALLLSLWIHGQSVNRTTPQTSHSQPLPSGQNSSSPNYPAPTKNGSTTQSQPQTVTPPGSSSAPQGSGERSIPSTGPSATMVWVALLVSLGSGAVFHLHQIRTMRAAEK